MISLRGKTLLVALGMAVLGTTVVFSAAPSGRVLRYKCEPGMRAAYDVKYSTTLDIKADTGEKHHAKTNSQTTCIVEYLGDTASGDFGVTGAVQPGTLNVIADGESGSSYYEENAAKYVVNRLGRIKSVTELTDNTMMSDDPSEVAMWVSPDGIFLLNGAGVLPEKAVKKGNSWKGSIRVPGAVYGEDETIDYKSTLLGEEKFREALCSKINTKATVGAVFSEDAPDGSGNVKVTVRVTLDYNWLFDPVRGMIVSTQGTERLAVTAKVTMDGAPLTAATVSALTNVSHTLNTINGEPLGAAPGG